MIFPFAIFLWRYFSNDWATSTIFTPNWTNKCPNGKEKQKLCFDIDESSKPTERYMHESGKSCVLCASKTITYTHLELMLHIHTNTSIGTLSPIHVGSMVVKEKNMFARALQPIRRHRCCRRLAVVFLFGFGDVFDYRNVALRVCLLSVCGWRRNGWPPPRPPHQQQLGNGDYAWLVAFCMYRRLVHVNVCLASPPPRAYSSTECECE